MVDEEVRGWRVWRTAAVLFQSDGEEPLAALRAPHGGGRELDEAGRLTTQRGGGSMTCSLDQNGWRAANAREA